MTENEPGELREPFVPEVGGEIVKAVANELTKAVAVVHGVDPITAAALGGTAGGSLAGHAAGAQRAYERRRLRAGRALDAAWETSGLEPHELLQLALEDDRKLELLVPAVEAAMRESDERRVRFYGRVAATGVLAEDDALVDRAARIFSTIARLDAADVKVLIHVASPGSPGSWVVDAPRQSEGIRNVLNLDLPELVDVMDSIVTRLETAGLLTMRSEGGLTYGTSYKVTDFARSCVAELLGNERS